MSVWKSFVLYNNSTGAPVPGKSLRLVDLAGVLPDVEMTASGAGVYRAQVSEGIWKVMDVTGQPTITDTGYRLDALSSLTNEPAIDSPVSTPSGKFWDGTKTFRVVEIADVDGLQAALDAEESAREGADTAETLARSNADAALDARVDVLEAAHTYGFPVVTIGDGTATPISPANGTLIEAIKGVGFRRLVGNVKLPAGISGFGASLPVTIFVVATNAFPPMAYERPYFGSFWIKSEVGGGGGGIAGAVVITAHTSGLVTLQLESQADGILTWSDVAAGQHIQMLLEGIY